MGTRNLTVVRSNGEIKVAQYGQYDGYPSAAGVEIIRALSYPEAVDNLKIGVEHCHWISDEDLEERWSLYGRDKDTGFVEWNKAKEFEESYPTLGRDIGAGIIEYIILHCFSDIELHNQIDFANDPTFCEWAYAIDLDNGVLETYCPYGSMRELQNYNEGMDCVLKDYAVPLVRVDSLYNLPDIENFCRELGDPIRSAAIW